MRHARKFIMFSSLGALLLSVAVNAAAATGHKATPEYQAIAAAFRITSETRADFDGDLVEEVAIAYRTGGSATPEGGLLVLKPSGSQFRPVFHVFFDSTYANEIRGQKGQIDLVLVRPGAAGDEEYLLTWSYGEIFVFNDHQRSFARNLQVTSSSRAKSGEASASNAIDNDLETYWAEGLDGTGVGESVTIKLSKPIGIGLIGLFPGRSPDARSFKNANRLHRATLEIQTDSDVGDEASALDFSDLGIDIGGDTDELVFDNKPEFRFFKIKRQKALNVVVKIDSVYLGDKDDDTCIAEIEIVPLIPRTYSLERAKKISKTTGSAPKVSGTVIQE